MKKVAVLYIATGKYVRLWPGFLESAEKYLLKAVRSSISYLPMSTIWRRRKTTRASTGFFRNHALAVHDIAAV